MAVQFTLGRNAARNERPQAQVWGNIGRYVKGKFVGLPMGIPLDTMQFVDETGSTEEQVKYRKQQNAQLRQMLELAQSVNPGETEDVFEMVVQIRRVRAPVTVSEDSAEDVLPPLKVASRSVHAESGYHEEEAPAPKPIRRARKSVDAGDERIPY